LSVISEIPTSSSEIKTGSTVIETSSLNPISSTGNTAPNQASTGTQSIFQSFSQTSDQKTTQSTTLIASTSTTPPVCLISYFALDEIQIKISDLIFLRYAQLQVVLFTAEQTK